MSPSTVSSSCVSGAAASSVTVTWCTSEVEVSSSEVEVISCGKKSQTGWKTNDADWGKIIISTPLVSSPVERWSRKFHPSPRPSPFGYFQSNLGGEMVKTVSGLHLWSAFQHFIHPETRERPVLMLQGNICITDHHVLSSAYLQCLLPPGLQAGQTPASDLLVALRP